MRMLFAALFQNAFEPGKAPWIISELRSVIAQIRTRVLNEPSGQGFFTEAELADLRQNADVAEVEICTCEDAIGIYRDIMRGTPHEATAERSTFAYIWLKK